MPRQSEQRNVHICLFSYLDFDTIVCWIDSIALSMRFYGLTQMRLAMHLVKWRVIGESLGLKFISCINSKPSITKRLF